MPFAKRCALSMGIQEHERYIHCHKNPSAAYHIFFMTTEPQIDCTYSGTVSKSIRLQYLLYTPDSKPGKSGWPLLLFLHGSGQRGNNLNQVKKHGPPKLIAAGRTFPFVVVSPQCPKDLCWQTDALNALIDEIVDKYKIDEDRIYVTGLSMGGYGTWSLALDYPERLAAIAPICGRSDLFRIRRISRIPAWVFHGADDPIVPLENSERMVKRLREQRADVKLTVYPKVKHDAWTRTYANPQLYEWLLQHRRSKS